MKKNERSEDKLTFKNKQMLLHLYEIEEGIKKNYCNDPVLIKEKMSIVFNNNTIEVNQSIIVTAFAFVELNDIYRLEGKSFIEEILLRLGDNQLSIPEETIVDLFKEIVRQIKQQIERECFKEKIVWVNKNNGDY